MWGVLISAVAIVLLGAGGWSILQTMTLIASLPFAVLMIFMMVSLWKALNNDANYFATAVNPSSIFWSGDHWRERLGQMMNQTQEVDIIKFMKNTDASGNAGIEKRIDRKIQYGRRNPLPVAAG